MLSLDLEEFTFEVKDGAIKHVGPSNKTATAKLYDVADVEVRAFGDKRVKLSFTDDDGSEVEVALFPEQAEAVGEGLDDLADEGVISE